MLAPQVGSSLTSRSPDSDRRARGENIMQRIVLLCTALAFGICASPLAAQQTRPEQPPQQTGPPGPAPPAGQSMPQETQPPPAPEAEPLPPPFPPMPKARPSHRWVDIGDHHSRRMRHHATPSHRQRTHAHHLARLAHHPAGHASRLQIRRCHSMSYRQIMRHSSCRTLMRQELAAAEHRHHHAAHAATRRHHRAVRRRRK